MAADVKVTCHFCGKDHPISELKKWYMPPVRVGRDEDGDGRWQSDVVPICPTCRPDKLEELKLSHG